MSNEWVDELRDPITPVIKYLYDTISNVSKHTYVSIKNMVAGNEAGQE